jgi:hypothetical protein
LKILEKVRYKWTEKSFAILINIGKAHKFIWDEAQLAYPPQWKNKDEKCNAAQN